MAKLVLSLNGTLLNQYFIDRTNLSIGRDKTNDIVVSDPLLSREHARIVCFGEDHIIEDLGSSNGTRINGQLLMRQILHHRDIVELGSHRLCYLNSRMAADIDMERTMLIKALPADGQPAWDAPAFAVPALRAAKTTTPEGWIKVLAGQGKHASGQEIRLDRVVTTFGIPGQRLVVIARRPQGFFLTHVEGKELPRINQQPINREAHTLSDGDRIEAAGCHLEFHLGAPA